MKVQCEKFEVIHRETYEFTKKDGVYSILIFFYDIALSFLFGLFVYRSNTNKELITFFNNKHMYKFLIQLPVTILELAPILFILNLRNQSLKTIGLSMKRIVYQIFLGILFSIPLFIIRNPIINNLNHYSICDYIWIFLYQFLLVALVEEILFRGFIQRRIGGIIKSKMLSVIVVGIMFGVAHIPLQLIIYTKSMGNFFIESLIGILFKTIIHMYFNYIYEIDKNVLAPTITHGISNILGTIFS